jgi:hypothetical protein
VQRVLTLRAACDPSHVRRMHIRDLVARVDLVNRNRFFAGLEPVAYPSTKVEVRR